MTPSAVQATIARWYHALEFPSRFDIDFQRALEEIPISPDTTVDHLEDYGPNGLKNLLQVLYVCETVKNRYQEKGIPETILMDTLHDIVLWLETWSKCNKQTFLGEVHWLRRHLRLNLFKLGRLQFAMGTAHHNVPSAGIAVGDPLLEVHIDRSAPLTPEACDQSFSMAKSFFATYFPEFRYRYISLHSWIMDPQITNWLPANCNILQFRDRFRLVGQDPSDSILKFILPWGTTRDNVQDVSVTSSFARRVRQEAINGTTFYEGLGLMEP